MTAGIRFPSFASIVIATIFAEHALLGGNRADFSLTFTVIYLLLLIALLSTKLAANNLEAISGSLIVPGLLFGLCFAVLVLPMRAHLNPANYRYSSSIDSQAQLIELIKLCGLASIFVIGAIFGCDRAKTRTVLKSTVVAGFVFSLFSIALKACWSSSKDDFAAGRLTATFISPNTAATLFGMIALLSMTKLLKIWNQHSHRSPSFAQQSERLLRGAPFETAAFFATMTCLVLTGSRAGLITFCLCLALLLIWEKRSRSINITLVVGACTLLIAAGGQLLIARLLDSGGDLPWHTELLAAHWHAVLKAPLSGYGLGSFPSVNATVMTPENMRQLVLMGAVHSVYLQWLEQAGLLGAAPMFACILWIMGRTALAAHNGPAGKDTMRGLTAVSCFIILHGVTDYALEVPSIAAIWALFLGLGYGIAERRSITKRGVVSE